MTSSSLRQRLAAAPAAAPLRSAVMRVLAAREFDRGHVGVPAERAKRLHLLELFRAGGHRTFVESGTYLGGTVAFFAPYAERVISVEVDRALFDRAVRRFEGAANIEIVHGDSLDEIPRIVSSMEDPPLVWLDGHFSEGVTSQGAEVEPADSILRRLGASGTPVGTTLVIDDVRLFGEYDGYPPLEQVFDTLREHFPDARLSVGMDALVVRV